MALAPTLELERLIIRLVGDTSGYSSALVQAQAMTRSAAQRMTELGKTMTFALTAPLVGFAALSVREAAKFETAMAHIEGLAGRPTAEVERMRVKVLELAGAWGRMPVEMAEALYFITSSGFSEQTGAIDILTISAKAAAAGLGDTKVIADLLTSAISAYGIANLTAAQAGDILVATIREGKAEGPQLARTLGRALPNAAALGVQFHELGAAVAAMTRVSGAEIAVTQMRQILSTLMDPTKEAEKALQAMGLSSAGLRKEIREKGLLSVLQTLSAAFNRLGPDQVSVVSDVFGNVRALTGALQLLGPNMADNVGIFERMQDTVGDLDDALQPVIRSVTFLWRQALAELLVAMIHLGDILGPVAIGIATALRTVSKAWTDSSAQAKRTITIFAGILAAIGPVLLLFGYLGPTFIAGFGMISNISGRIVHLAALFGRFGILSTLGGVGTQFLFPFILLGLAIAGVITYLGGFEEAWDLVLKAGNIAMQYMGAGIRLLMLLFMNLEEIATGAWNAIYAAIKPVTLAVVEFVKSAVGTVLGFLTNISGGMAEVQQVLNKEGVLVPLQIFQVNTGLIAQFALLAFGVYALSFAMTILARGIGFVASAWAFLRIQQALAFGGMLLIKSAALLVAGLIIYNFVTMAGVIWESVTAIAASIYELVVSWTEWTLTFLQNNANLVLAAVLLAGGIYSVIVAARVAVFTMAILRAVYVALGIQTLVAYISIMLFNAGLIVIRASLIAFKIGLVAIKVGVAAVMFVMFLLKLSITAVIAVITLFKAIGIGGTIVMGIWAVMTGIAQVATWALNAAIAFLSTVTFVQLVTNIAAALVAIALLTAAFLYIGSAVYAVWITLTSLATAVLSLSNVASGPITAIGNIFYEWYEILLGVITIARVSMPLAWEYLKAGAALAVSQVRDLWPPLWAFISGGFVILSTLVRKVFVASFDEAFYTIAGKIQTLLVDILDTFIAGINLPFRIIRSLGDMSLATLTRTLYAMMRELVRFVTQNPLIQFLAPGLQFAAMAVDLPGLAQSITEAEAAQLAAQAQANQQMPRPAQTFAQLAEAARQARERAVQEAVLAATQLGGQFQFTETPATAALRKNFGMFQDALLEIQRGGTVSMGMGTDEAGNQLAGFNQQVQQVLQNINNLNGTVPSPDTKDVKDATKDIKDLNAALFGSAEAKGRITDYLESMKGYQKATARPAAAAAAAAAGGAAAAAGARQQGAAPPGAQPNVGAQQGRPQATEEGQREIARLIAESNRLLQLLVDRPPVILPPANFA